ncbi:glucose-6-phosphate dehydrogenase [Hyaloraphidium curvatum]|nr:glucose-6-phosphate dehydrogenase [Hyaloraphidium curvatum]
MADEHTTVVVLGASGDLAFKKTFPALFNLFKNGLLPPSCALVGYARTKLPLDDFRARVTQNIKLRAPGDETHLARFRLLLRYLDGQYDVEEPFRKLDAFCTELEGDRPVANRIFYLALPPNVFAAASANLRSLCYSKRGHNRLIIEKPFGSDLPSSNELDRAISKHWAEDEVYRIDHYLGKEMVKSLLVLRFANQFLGGIWDRSHIAHVQITFKEMIGTEGRGGYFDEFGIIRDVMQNHLLQVLSLIAMERPMSLDAQDVRNEKVRVLKYIRPLALEDCVLGQYTASLDGKKPGYKDDKTVPKDSIVPTFAAARFYVSNERWDGVPFIVKCGKALDDQKVDIRIQFRDVPGNPLFSKIARNELVIRIQPNEAVYIKTMTKTPGYSNEPTIAELDLSYSQRFSNAYIPDAYESLILDVLKGDQNNFVRNDELEESWKIFTPLLHQIDRERIQPEPYPYGSRGPAAADRLLIDSGFQRHELEYDWPKVFSKAKL